MENGDKKTTSQEDRIIDDAFRDVLNGYLASNHRKKVEIIERAYRFAREAHAGVRRRSGEPYILHPIAVARIVSREIGLGSTSICAALLHDVVEDTDYTVDDIARHFGPKIAQIVEGLTKISGGIFGDRASAQAENFRKLLLTMSEDIRVVLIKMADRLHNMRTLGSMAPNKQYKIAGETLYIYAPLAHRLGLFSIKTELEDLAFKYEHPKAWAEITEKIKQSEERREAVYADFAAPIREKLDAMGLVYESKARLKSCYSIWKKMKAKQIPFEEVYDLYAVRIVFECDDISKEKQICWNIYAAITDLHKLHPERLRDWISTPKANGYQALHLTVMGPDGNWIEVQIRSRRMDEIAEKGFAAHWKYKIGGADEESELTVWLRTIKDILDHPDPNAIDFLDTLKLNLFASEIVVFTPKGELVTLPMDSTVLDMAFALHSELGMHCIAGKVNHKLVPLNYKLRSGDQIEVLTSQTQTPQAEWMGFLRTAKAKSRIRAYIRRERQPVIARGREMIESFFRRHHLPCNNDTIAILSDQLGIPQLDDIRYAVAKGEAELTDEIAAEIAARRTSPKKEKKRFKSFLRSTLSLATFGTIKARDDAPEAADPASPSAPGAAPAPSPVAAINTKETYELRTGPDGVSNFRVADCCSPIPGDEVMGFIEDNGDVTVHALTCPRALVLKASYGQRILSTKWAVSSSKFLAHIRVEGIDRHGILQEITLLISTQLEIDLRRLDIEATGEVFHSDLWVRVEDADVVSTMCTRLLDIDGVERATRIQ